MLTGAGTGPLTPRAVPGAETSRPELLNRYRAYRRRQARGLLHMLPRQAVRPLYRRALRAAAADGRPGPDPDSMEVLLAYLERLLPLPPFEVWRADVARSPDAHLHEIGDSAEAPAADAPVTVETRELSLGDRDWAAHLRSFRDGDTWRGFIAFEDRLSSEVHRTALIFRESDAVGVRERFSSFEPRTLEAFLRSALP